MQKFCNIWYEIENKGVYFGIYNSAQGTLLPSRLSVRVKQGTISTNITDNVTAESDSGKEKFGEYIGTIGLIGISLGVEGNAL